MSIGRIVARKMAKIGNVKMFHGDVIGVSPDIEWIKWLSYEPEFEKKRIKYLDSKEVSELSCEELEEVSRNKRNKIYARLFKIYGTSECSEEDYMRVYDYMCNESIEELMLSKLTSEELQYAKQEINRLIKGSDLQLRAKVHEEQRLENYEKLSMVDSYILHFLSKIDFTRDMSALKREIDIHLEQNQVARQRSLYYASNPHARK